MEAAAKAWLAFHPDASSVFLHQPLCNGQAKSRSFARPARGRIYLVKAVEDGIMFLRRYADPRIAHRNLRESIHLVCLDPDGPTVRREFESVAQQVVEDLPDTDT